MYKISEFAAVCGTTTKTIRFYDSAGVLEADYIDPSNGYRYYKSDKVQQYYKIISLKQIGFTIDEIKSRFLNADDSAVLAALKEKESKLLQAYQNCKDIISVYEEKIKMLNESQSNKVHITRDGDVIELSCGNAAARILCIPEDVGECKNILNDLLNSEFFQIPFDDIANLVDPNKPVVVKHGKACGENRGLNAAKQVLADDREVNAIVSMNVSKYESVPEVEIATMEISNNMSADATIIWGVGFEDRDEDSIEINVMYFPIK